MRTPLPADVSHRELTWFVRLTIADLFYLIFSLTAGPLAAIFMGFAVAFVGVMVTYGISP